MAKYKVYEEKLVTAVWVYEVEADSEREALDIIQEREIDIEEVNHDYFIEDNYTDDYDYRVEEV